MEPWWLLPFLIKWLNGSYPPWPEMTRKSKFKIWSMISPECASRSHDLKLGTSSFKWLETGTLFLPDFILWTLLCQTDMGISSLLLLFQIARIILQASQISLWKKRGNLSHDFKELETVCLEGCNIFEVSYFISKNCMKLWQCILQYICAYLILRQNPL